MTFRLIVPALAALTLASCVYPAYHGRDNYAEGMRRLRYEPAAAPEYFAAADRDFVEALADSGLESGERVMATTMRARCLIELERYTEVPNLLAAPIQGYEAARNYPGDVIGLSLLKASKLDPEHAYSELLLAEKKAATLRARQYVAWAQVHTLQRIGTPKARAEAVKICDAYKGKIDFDDLKAQLQ